MCSQTGFAVAFHITRIQWLIGNSEEIEYNMSVSLLIEYINSGAIITLTRASSFSEYTIHFSMFSDSDCYSVFQSFEK